MMDGTPLACESMPDAWGALDRVQRLTYETVSGTGEPAVAEAIIRTPPGPAPERGWPVVAWDHGTSGIGQQCGLTGSPEIEANTALVIKRLNTAGFAVVAPDYLGLSPASPGPHPYLHSRSEATATIDAVRAARIAMPDLGAEWAVAGESQGGHAALATAHQATRRAPDLDFRGTVAVSPASNIETVFRRVRPGGRPIPLFPVGSFAAVLTGMTVGQSDVDVRDYLSPDGLRIIDAIADTCSPAWTSVVGELTAADLVSKPLATPEFADALRRYMKVETSGYDAPVLIVHGLRDVRVPLPLTLALLAQLRRGGTRVKFRLVDASHDDLLLVKGGLDIAVTYLDTILGSSGATEFEM